MFRRLAGLLCPRPGKAGKGSHFEIEARRYLRRRGLRNFQLNYRSRHGEIDLVARDADTLVFVEVRYRQKTSHGGAAVTVDWAKQKKIRRTALHFLQKNGLNNKMPCRFDVVAITGDIDRPEFYWIKNAF